MDVSLFSARYSVRHLDQKDVPDILALCRENTLFYQHCPPFVTAQKITDDMKALPPGKEMSDKHYIGYYDAGSLLAVMDFILAYPNEHTAFIGFFMTKVSTQNAIICRISVLHKSALAGSKEIPSRSISGTRTALPKPDSHMTQTGIP